MEELLGQLKLDEYVQALFQAGYETVEDLAAAKEDELIMDVGMRRPQARRICRYVKAVPAQVTAHASTAPISNGASTAMASLPAGLRCVGVFGMLSTC